MQQLTLFDVSLKSDELGEVIIKVDFNKDLQQYITEDEIKSLMSREDEEGLIVFTTKIVEELQKRMQRKEI